MEKSALKKYLEENRKKVDRTELRNWIKHLFTLCGQNDQCTEEMVQVTIMFVTGKLYQEAKISKGRAAELSEVNICDQSHFIDNHGLNYPSAE